MEVKSIKENEITHGIIWKELLRFFFPILFGSLFLQLYNTVDAIIVGRLLGKEALTAVGSGTSTAINLLIGFFTGLSSGATVIISHYYGAEDEEKVKKAIHNAAAIALWGGIIISVLGYLTTKPILLWVGTPEDVLPLAIDYMHIYFGFAFIVVMYNIGAAIFRAIGDSKRPLYFLIVGSIVNVVLDLLCVGVWNMGVKGAAYATVISQFISLILVTVSLLRRNDCCALVLRSIRINSLMFKSTIRIGFPAGIQSIMFSVSNLMILAGVNKFGTDTAAAWAAYGKIDFLFWTIFQAFSISITTFVGQNYGAGFIPRAKKGIRQCFVMVCIVTALCEVLYILLGRAALYLFVNDLSVIEIGMKIIRCVVPFFFLYIPAEIFSGALRGAGNTFVPTLIVVFCICGLRAIWLLIIPSLSSTIEMVMYCYPVTWLITSTALTVYYFFGKAFPNAKHSAV